MLELLSRAVAEVQELDVDAMSNAELSGSVVELQRLRSQLEAADARLTSAWDARRCWQDDGARNGAAWLRSKGRMASASAGRRLRMARAVRCMPTVEKAWAAGEISSDHVHTLVRARRPETEQCFARDEKVLVDLARDPTLRFADFETAVQYWLQGADPDGTERCAAEQHGRRRMHLSQSLGGWWYGEFGLDPVSGAIVNETLEQIYEELFREDWAEAKARVGEKVTATDLSRSATQRLADAQVEMAIRARTAPADGRRPAPLFTVLVGYETFAGRICELASGTVVAPWSLVPWLDEAYIERIVFDGPSRVTDIGQQRCFTGALRRAIEVRDRICYHPTCDIPGYRCQVDHVIPSAAGGPTILENGRLACGFHNLLRHRQRGPSSEEEGDPGTPD